MVGQPNERVLLVDDEPGVRKLISGHLVAAGYVVRVAVDGLDAIEKLRTGPPDLIISDLNMPRMSGIEFLGVVRERFPQIPVIVISGVAADEIPKGVAADAYFHKNGFGFDQLLQTISHLTRNPPLRTAPPDVNNNPVQARWDGNGHYIMRCEDCLRQFNVLRDPYLGRSAIWTVCAYCGKVLRFLVAEVDPQGPAQP